MSPTSTVFRRARFTVIAFAVAASVAATPTGCDPNALNAGGGGAAAASSKGGPDIPADYLALYKQHGGRCKGLSWQLLAGVGQVETDHGRSPLRGVHSGANSAGAMGPMQFLQATFNGVRKKHPEIGANLYLPVNAIPAAAAYLCDSGLPTSEYKALFTYNNAGWYVRKVQAQARKYRAYS